MVGRLKVINFLQDFGCARLNQLQKLFNAPEDNFRNILTGNLVNKKGDIFVYNNKVIDNSMLVALDILCKYKGRFKQFYKSYSPIYITFLSKENLVYHIIVVEEGNEKGIVKLLNSRKIVFPNADRLILAFKDEEEFENIECDIPFLYCTYPKLEIINIK